MLPCKRFCITLYNRVVKLLTKAPHVILEYLSDYEVLNLILVFSSRVIRFSFLSQKGSDCRNKISENAFMLVSSSYPLSLIFSLFRRCEIIFGTCDVDVTGLAATKDFLLAPRGTCSSYNFCMEYYYP